jgi:hypothetical protein
VKGFALAIAAGAYQPRWASSWSVSSLEDSKLTIALPSPVDATATRSGSA